MNYDEQIMKLLSPLLSKAIEKGEDEVLSLVCSIERYSKELREFRQLMEVEPVFHCNDCGKHWTVKVTVKRARDMGEPYNCPTCYNKNPDRWVSRSGYTDTFRYVDNPTHPSGHL